jgi:hypothetical protein
MSEKVARREARIGGVLYLLIIIIGALEEAVVRGRIVVPGNAVATAANLRELEWLWRLGFTGEVVLLVSAVFLALILYRLLRPVHRDLALLAVLFNLMTIAIEAVAAVSLTSALTPLHGAASGFTTEQLARLADLGYRGHTAGFSIALVFFGIECIILGYLIRRSRYMPSWVGTLMQVGGICYVINSFAWLLSPALSTILFPAILLPSLIGELSLSIWLLTKGVRGGQWPEHAALEETPRTS